MMDIKQRHHEAYAEVRRSVGDFLVEFATLDSHISTAVLKSLCSDATLVEYLPEIVDFGNRLKLIKWVAERHTLPKTLAADLAAALKDAKRPIAKCGKERDCGFTAELQRLQNELVALREQAGLNRK